MKWIVNTLLGGTLNITVRIVLRYAREAFRDRADVDRQIAGYIQNYYYNRMYREPGQGSVYTRDGRPMYVCRERCGVDRCRCHDTSKVTMNLGEPARRCNNALCIRNPPFTYREPAYSWTMTRIPLGYSNPLATRLYQTSQDRYYIQNTNETDIFQGSMKVRVYVIKSK